MEDESNKEEISDSFFNKNNRIEDYEYLLSRLKDIKESITLLEKNFYLDN